MKITQAYFKKLIHYDPRTGIFTNLVSRGPRLLGTRAGTIHNISGYRYLTIEGQKYAEHQWAFLFMIGRLPKNEVDHCNGITGDNRWKNLREADRFKNLANARVRRNGLKGVSRLRNRWTARIMHKGKLFRLGWFATECEAHAAYVKKSLKLNGIFARAA